MEKLAYIKKTTAFAASKWQKQLACMKELPEFKSRGVSFNKEWEKTSRKVSNMENKSLCSVYKEHMDISRSPNHAMEFLCRSWSPSASDFQQMFPSSNLFMSLNADERIEEHGEIEEHEERKVQEKLENQALNSKHKATEADKTWMDFSHMKGWLKGKSLTNLFRSQREKKKEEVRLHTAKLHAALSLTQLAAAIAGFATNGSSTEAQDHIKHLTSSNAGRTTVLEWDQDMGVVVASAAALLTAVCAEAAEALGAKRARVASAVKSGLATQTPIDMITLTATAATCLRGAATLESRAKADAYFPRIQELLKVGVQTLIITPSGDRGLKWVRIHLKQRQPTLSFRKKYLGGALTASKQYKIINVLEEIKDDKGSNFLSLQTNKGIIKLLFDNEKQSIIFVSAISNLLQIHNTCEIMESRKL